MKKKWLYAFRVNREIEVEETESQKNDKGEDIKVTKTVKQTRPVLLRLHKPGRKLFDEGELYYGIKLSEGIKAGLLTRALLAKRYQNDGGAMSEPDKEKYSELYLSLFEKENELQRLQLNLEKKSEDEKRDKISDLLMEMADLRRELQDFESAQSALFDQTAETRAKNKTVMWWVLNLAQIEKKSDEIKDWHWYNKEEAASTDEEKENAKKEIEKLSFDFLFEGETLEDKMDKYDEMEDSDDGFWSEALRKLAYFVSYWYSGQADSEEDFQRVEDFLNTEEGVNLTAETEEEKTEEKAEEKAPEEKKAEEKAPEEKAPEEKAPEEKAPEEKKTEEKPRKEVIVKPEETFSAEKAPAKKPSEKKVEA